MKDTDHNEWHRLFSGALNGTITDAEKTQLAALLKSSAEARQLWFLYNDNECGLAELKPLMSAATPASKKQTARLPWLSWRPLTAAAAGLVIGLSSATLGWGYVGSYAAKAITLLQDGFESGPPPQVTGVPTAPGSWSGDFSEVTGEYQGVKPAGGKKMLRFLRADYEGKQGRDGYIADVFRIIDLRGSELDVSRGDACVSVEAKFRSLHQPKLGRISCSVTIHALDALPSPEERQQFFVKATSGIPEADTDDPNSSATILATTTRHEAFESAGDEWQTVRSELRVPPGSRYFMIHLHEWLLDSKGPHQPQPVNFAGLFVDEVRVTLAHRPPLP